MLSGIDRKKILLVLLLSLCCFSQFACGQSEEQKVAEINKHEEAAKQFRQKGDFQAALQEQLKAVELNPNDDESLRLLGGIYIDLKQYEKAVEILERGKKINSANAQIHYELGIALRRLTDDRTQVLKEFQEAVRIEPANSLFLTNLGGTFEEMNDRKSARECYLKAMQANSKYIPAIYLLALMEIEDRNLAKGEELLKKVISLDPTTETDKIYKDEAIKKLKESNN